MEHFEITKTADGFHIEGFPDAVRVLRIPGPKSRRLADLALHKVDLDFTLECLEAINSTPDEPHIFRRVLWHSAIVHFIKCFGQSESRFSLDSNVVYKSPKKRVWVERGGFKLWMELTSYKPGMVFYLNHFHKFSIR